MLKEDVKVVFLFCSIYSENSSFVSTYLKLFWHYQLPSWQKSHHQGILSSENSRMSPKRKQRRLCYVPYVHKVSLQCVFWHAF